MTATSTPLGSDFPKQMTDLLFESMKEGAIIGVRMMWDILMTFLSTHLLAVMAVLLIALVFTFLKAMTGRWGSLGSFLYNLFYFGTLLIIGLIWGPEVFTSNVFGVASAVILYPVCYYVVGIILDHTGLRRH